MGAPTHERRLPLRLRLPNPPVAFFGRDAEQRQLEQAIERAPVTVVWGLGGLGKTALVLRTLHRAFPAQAPKTLFVRLEPGHAGEQGRLELVRALALACGVDGLPWARLVADRELLSGMAIDLAEDAGLWIVLDDLRLDAGADDLLADLARYARHSRWIATSRELPRHAELVGQTLALGRLSDDALASLARACSPTSAPGHIARVVSAAGGSPWQVRQLVLGERCADGADSLAGLAAPEVELLERLSHVAIALTSQVLARLAPDCTPAALDALERRGFLERHGDGFRVHDVARARIRKRPAARASSTLQATARVLVDEPDPALRIEGLRIFVVGGGIDAAALALDRHAVLLMREGYAPRLWRLLEQGNAAALASWRLRVGVAIGAPEVLASLSALAAPSVADDLDWCRALLAAGRHGEAASRANALREHAAHQLEIAFEAGVIQARAQTLLGEHRLALGLLESLSARSPLQSARRDAQAASCHALLGEFEAAQRIAHRLASELHHLDAHERVEIANSLLAVLLVLGDLERALLVLASLAKAPGDGPPSLHQTRSTLLLRATLGVSLGELGESREVFAQLRPLFERRSLEGLVLQHSEILRRIIAGEFDRFRARLAEALADAEAAKSPFFVRWCGIWSAYWAIIDAAPDLGEATPAHFETPQLPGGHPGLGAALTFVDALHAARNGATGSPSEWLTALPPIWSAVLGGMLRAFWALWGGAESRALAELELGIDACRAHGYRTFELEQCAFACEILLVQERWSELAQWAQTLAELAERSGSERFAIEGAFHMSIAADPLPRVDAFERWALQDAIAPMCARRSRALLGGSFVGDRVDRAIVDAARARHGDWRISLLVASTSERAGWGLDGARREVWLPDGRTLAMSQRPLMWSALEAIAEGAGAVTLEALATRLWGVSAYHPLRDNGRIHTLINRIRQQLESDHKKPSRLITTSEGYRFGDGEPVRWLHPARR